MSTAGVLPVFLLGGLIVALREEMSLGDDRLGVLVATFFLASTTASLPGGQLAERAGVRWAVWVAALASGSALLGAALFASTSVHLALVLVLAGLGNGVAQPTSNLVLARGVAPARQGTAFGIKQAAIPAATMISGGAGAVLAEAVGWRWAYGGWAAVALLVVAVLPTGLERTVPRTPGGRLREGDVSTGPMLLLAAAGGVGAAVGTSLASFFVTSAVSSGIGAGMAGGILTAASLVGITARLTLGFVADRMARGHFRLVLRLALAGAIGFAGLAWAHSSTLLVAAAFLSFAAGWGWPGLFNYAVVRWNRNAPGAATAITQAGVFVGGVVGPASFGAVAARWSFATAWLGTAALSVVSAACIQLARRALVAERDRGVVTPVVVTPKNT